jgi:hypothetical protein
MPNLSEKEKVRQICLKLEETLKGDLYFRDEDHKVGSLQPSRIGFGSELGRPDAIVWVELELQVLGVPVRIRMPILIEAEEAGMEAAKDDYELFFERNELEIPMVVVSKERALRKKSSVSTKARVKVVSHQIGFDRI